MDELYSALIFFKRGKLRSIYKKQPTLLNRGIVIGSDNPVTCLEIAMMLDNERLFKFLLGLGADPRFSATTLIANVKYLEIILSDSQGLALCMPWNEFVESRLNRLRGKEKAAYHQLLLKYDYPVPYGDTKRNQTEVECIKYKNIIGLKRCSFKINRANINMLIGQARAQNFEEGEIYLKNLSCEQLNN